MRIRSWSIAPVALLTAIWLGACGSSTIDATEVEDQIRPGIEEELSSQGVEGTVTVECPDGVESETGNTFECTAEFSDGTSATIDAEVTDGENGDVHWEVRG